MTRLLRAAALALGVLLVAAATPAPAAPPAGAPPVVVASASTLPVATVTPNTAMRYEAEVALALSSRFGRIDLATTLTITPPDEGLDALTIAVAARGFGAWEDGTLRVDGVERPFVYDPVDGIALQIDLADNPWAAGEPHTVQIAGIVRPGRSSDTQGLLRLIGSGAARVLTFGDMLPLPMRAPRHPVFSDPLSAPVAERIGVTITTARALPRAAVIANGELVERPSGPRGTRWRYELDHVRSFVLLVSERYGTSRATMTLPGPDGADQSVTVSVHGPSRTVRAASLSVAVAALRDLWARFGPGPYARLRLMVVPGVGFAHEFPGAAFIGSAFSPALRNHVIRHEIAHQWWQAMVATHQGDHPWMDEALAEWSARRVEGSSAAPAHACSRPIDGPAYRAPGYYRAFFGTNSYWQCVYLRGTAMFFRLGDAIGDGRLESCLRDYAQAHRFASPEPAALIAALRGCAADDAERAAVETVIAAHLSPATIGE